MIELKAPSIQKEVKRKEKGMKKEKNFLSKLKAAFKRADAFVSERTLTSYVIYSFVLCLIMEALSRRAFFGGFEYLIKSPLLFLYNTLIILLTLSISLFFTNKYVVGGVVSALWLVLGVMNCVVLSYRITPVGFIDIALLDSFVNIMWIYLKVWQVILMAVGAVLFIVGCVFAWKKLPRCKVRLRRVLPMVALVTLLFLSSTLYANAKGALPEDFGNLKEDYSEYGFAYCFSRSVVDRGVEKPKDYGKEYIDGIVADLGEDEIAIDSRPNVIVLQLEAFFDAEYLKDISFSANPTPVFDALKKNNRHGFISVPALGAGTANTEFEVLTGLNISHFGAGEYPYKTILGEKACESMAFLFSELGYNTFALHNNNGAFYDRHDVYAMLGFDRYVPLEYMQDYEENPLGWAKDIVLKTEIEKALDSTEGSDFVFAVSVQAHGKYPRKELEGAENRIDLSGFADERDEIAFEYFVNQIYETDAFVGELLASLSEREEQTIVVIYGDHLPGLEIANEDLSAGNIFTTEYVIWKNYEYSEEKSEDIEAYQLSSVIFEELGYKYGLFNKLHSAYRGSGSAYYSEALRALAYDTLYGDAYAYGKRRYERTDMKMGVDEIEISDASPVGERLYLYGHGFTEFSTVKVDGKKTDTEFIDGGTLVIELPRGDGVLTVIQSGADGIVLSESKGFSFVAEN